VVIINLKKQTTGDKIFEFTSVFSIVILCLLTLYPFLFVIARSVMPDTERALRPFALIPHDIDLIGYEYIFGQSSRLYRAYGITLFRTIVGTALSVFVESMFAYAISQKEYPLRKALSLMIVITMWFQGGMIPKFLVIKSVGLYNSVWVYVLLPLMTAWYIFILRSFFSGIPDSIKESARIDGANEFTIFVKLILPLSTAVLATVSLFHIVYHWNEWFSGIIFVNDPKKIPVQVLLRQMLNSAMQSEMIDEDLGAEFTPPAVTLQMAMIVVVAFPIVAVYPFFQKHFVKGMMLGSVKG
jgi:putative aldouronate transport system permease protein